MDGALKSTTAPASVDREGPAQVDEESLSVFKTAVANFRIAIDQNREQSIQHNVTYDSLSDAGGTYGKATALILPQLGGHSVLRQAIQKSNVCFSELVLYRKSENQQTGPPMAVSLSLISRSHAASLTLQVVLVL